MHNLTMNEAPNDSQGKPLTRNAHLTKWVADMAKLTKPDNIVWVDGSEDEKKRLTERAVKDGTLTALNHEKLPG